MIRHTTFRVAAPDNNDRTTWHDKAACLHVDPEWMFPGKIPAEIRRAKDICRACPVIAECLAAAMAEEGNKCKENRHGIRGGLSGGQRYRRYQSQPADQPQPETTAADKPAPKNLLAPCGTRSAYQRHVRNHEPIDDACRQANTDADNRLRRTGTTKAAA